MRPCTSTPSKPAFSARTAADTNASIARPDLGRGERPDALRLVGPRRDRLGAGDLGVGAQSTVVQLHRGDGAGGAQVVGQPGQAGQVPVVADAELAVPRLALRSDVRRARHDQAEAAAAPEPPASVARRR